MVVEGSPAAKGGLRFGDQILEVDWDDLAGLNSDQVISVLLLIYIGMLYLDFEPHNQLLSNVPNSLI